MPTADILKLDPQSVKLYELLGLGMKRDDIRKELKISKPVYYGKLKKLNDYNNLPEVRKELETKVDANWNKLFNMNDRDLIKSESDPHLRVKVMKNAIYLNSTYIDYLLKVGRIEKPVEKIEVINKGNNIYIEKAIFNKYILGKDDKTSDVVETTAEIEVDASGQDTTIEA